MGPLAHTKKITVEMLGIKVHPVILDNLERLIADCTAKKWIFANHNLHSIYLFHQDEKMRRFYAQADLILIDGMPIVWIARLLGYGVSRKNRLATLDWLFTILEECANKKLRVFLLGSKPSVAEKAAAIFSREIPELKIDFHHGYFDANPSSNDNFEVVDRINQFETNILLVGMGMPRQEHWILDNIDQLNINVAWSNGGFMDYFAGEQTLPPRWLGQLGLEWLFRLLSNPKRLWRRYLLEPWFVLKLVICDFFEKKILINKKTEN